MKKKKRRRRMKKRSDAQRIIIYRVTTVRKHMEVTQLQSLLMFSIQLDVWRGF